MEMTIICDANVLIDYSKADINIIRSVAELYGGVHVPDLIAKEAGLDRKLLEELGATVVESPLDLPSIPGLSLQDRVCLHYAEQSKCSCLTNDRLLKKHCLKAGARVIWGLEMILELVSASIITFEYAVGVSKVIYRENIEMTDSIYEEFRHKLDRIHCQSINCS